MRNEREAMAPPKGAAGKTAEIIEIEHSDTLHIGEGAESSKPTKSSRQSPKGKQSKRNQQPKDDEQTETTEPPKKKLKSTFGKDQTKFDKGEPSAANPGRTRSTRTWDRPPPDKMEEPDDDNKPSLSAAARKRPRKKAQ